MFTIKMTWLFGGFSSTQPPSYNGTVIPAPAFAGVNSAGIHKFKFSFVGVSKTCP